MTTGNATAVRPPPVPPVKPEPVPVPNEVAALGLLFQEIGQDPKYRGQLLSMIREHAPNLPIPELDIEKSVHARLEAETKPLLEQNKSLTERLGTLERSIARDRWATEHGLSEEEMVEFETFAKDKKMGDAESALDYWQKSSLGRPRGTSAPVALSDESRKALHKNPREWALKRGEEVLADFRRRRGA